MDESIARREPFKVVCAQFILVVMGNNPIAIRNVHALREGKSHSEGEGDRRRWSCDFLCCLVLFCAALSCFVLCCPMFSCVFNCVVLSVYVFCCIVLCCVVLCCHMLRLSCLILSCVELSCVVLFLSFFLLSYHAGIILDLEDSISPSAKDEARRNAMRSFEDGAGFKPKTTVTLRVNGTESPWWKDDLAALVANPAALRQVDAIVLPKVNRKDDINMCIEEFQRLVGSNSTTIPIWAMIETPLGVINVEEIASHQDVSCLVLGTADLTKDMHAQHTPDRLPMMYSLSKSLLAARAYGKRVLDGVHLDLKDEEGFRSVCAQGRAMGFDGKTLIHPSTIQTANEVFAPTSEEVSKARKIVDAWIEAEKSNTGVTVVDGRLVERLHVEDAQRLLDMHKIITSPD